MILVIKLAYDIKYKNDTIAFLVYGTRLLSYRIWFLGRYVYNGILCYQQYVYTKKNQKKEEDKINNQIKFDEDISQKIEII